MYIWRALYFLSLWDECCVINSPSMYFCAPVHLLYDVFFVTNYKTTKST